MGTLAPDEIHVMACMFTEPPSCPARVYSHKLLAGPGQYYEYINTAVWHTRVMPRLIVELLFVFEITRRVYDNYIRRQRG